MSREQLLTILRSEKTSLRDFRRAAYKLAYLLAGEVADLLHHDSIEVRTPLALAHGVQYNRRLVLAPVLRAGLAFLPAFLDFFEDAIVGMVGVQRDPESAVGKGYYLRLPKISLNDDVVVLDPLIASGGSAQVTLEAAKAAGAVEERMIYVSAIASPEGLKLLKETYPKLCILVAQVDEGLDSQKYILPGLGDFGDRFFGTL